MAMDQKSCNLHVRRGFGHLVIGHEGQGAGVRLAETCERRDLCLEVAVNGPSNDFMDLGEREWCGELRPTHRIVPFFFVFELNATLGFFAARGLGFAETDFADDGFFEVAFVELVFFETGFFGAALAGFAAGIGASDWGVDGGSANRLWT